MPDSENLQPELRGKALRILSGIGQDKREALIVKNWMSHDARWFNAVLEECGMEVTNRINQAAAHELGKVEAQRALRLSGQGALDTMGDFLPLQELVMVLLGPELLEYRVVASGEDAYRIEIERCFAHDNISAVGLGEHYQCGIFARVTGWLEGMRFAYRMTPSLGLCMKCQGLECAYAFSGVRKKRSG